MKYAIHIEQRIEPIKGIDAKCPHCGAYVVAKCGNVKLHHWAHKSISLCDNWWESETEWHRTWKNQYPPEWQEYSFQDTQTKERHIADVKTTENIVIEFQHSPITDVELKSRESFYNPMIWVVDATRSKREHNRFIAGIKKYTKRINEFYEVDSFDEILPTNWRNSSVPVILDLGSSISDIKIGANKSILYLILPEKIHRARERIIYEVNKEDFISHTKNCSWQSYYNQLIKPFIKNTPFPSIPQHNMAQSIINPPKRESNIVYDPRKGRFKPHRRF